MEQHEYEISEKKLEAAKKNFEWIEISMPCTAAQDAQHQAQSCHRTGGGGGERLYSPDGHSAVPQGIALPPHERDCGRSHPMRGTNSEDLTDWCIQHET